MDPMIVGSLVRWALNLIAGNGDLVTDDTVSQITSGVIAAGTLAWTIWSNYRTKQKHAFELRNAALTGEMPAK